jgi:hypothetical protein
MGISISGSNNQIGSPGQGNVIFGHTSVGLIIIGGADHESNNNTIQANTIRDRQNNGQTAAGIAVLGLASGNLIGGPNDADKNTITNNHAIGIGLIQKGDDKPTKNTILRNAIFDTSFPWIDLMIDTNGDYQPDQSVGPTPNDIGDIDSGPNDLLNTPVINQASIQNGQVQLDFDLDINDNELASQGYRVDFYATNPNQPTSEVYLGSTIVSGDVTDQQLSLPTTISTQDYLITATTTELDGSSDGFGSTSEYSQPINTSNVQARNDAVSDRARKYAPVTTYS